MQKTVALDTFDFRILEALEANGALSNNELAETAGLSASQCSRRRQRLEETGIIRGYRAELDPTRLGLGLTVFVQVTLRTHNPDNSRRFRELLEKLPEVQEAYMLTGESDYLIKVSVPDLDVLTRLITVALLPHDSVDRVKSNIVLQTLKQRSSLVPGLEAAARR